jgi:electron transfer flavoprotein alpha subunit
MFPPMPLADPVLVLADQGQADDDVVPTQEAHELIALARRLGTPVLVDCPVGEAADILIDIAERTPPRAILITSRTATDSVAARLAVHLECAILTDVTAISLENGHLVAAQESMPGAERVTTEVHSATAVITVRPRTTTSAHKAGQAGRELLLTEADVVVAGGRGVGSAEGFSLLARLAYALGGCLGGTHTAGELGWAPQHACISVPGAQIRPRLYFASGVSGSVRHRAAIRRARSVVAIDSDPEAPIFREADFGIVGDLHRVLPAVLDELARRASPASSTAPTSLTSPVPPAAPDPDPALDPSLPIPISAEA